MTKILCVHGKTKDLNFIVQALEESQYPCKIFQASSHQEIIQDVTEIQPDVLIMDYEPSISSELIKQQREELIPFTPLILTIEPSQLASIPLDWRSDTIDYICKPIHPSLLIKRIQVATKTISLHNALSQQKGILDDMQLEQNYLMSIVAHDLKAPLNKVLGLIQLMPMVGPLNKEQQSCVQMVNKVIEQGRKLIDDILTINAYEAQLEFLDLEWIDINEFMREVIESYENQAQEKEITLHSRIEHGLRLYNERESLSRIIDNLLSNAIKFSNPQKSIHVQVALSEENKIQIMIKDQGPGITPADQKKMFKKFQTLSAKPTGGESSTGLGLSIIQALVKKLKGEITFESEIGQGTTFFVTLPNLENEKQK